LGQN